MDQNSPSASSAELPDWALANDFLPLFKHVKLLAQRRHVSEAEVLDALRIAWSKRPPAGGVRKGAGRKAEDWGKLTGGAHDENGVLPAMDEWQLQLRAVIEKAIVNPAMSDIEAFRRIMAERVPNQDAVTLAKRLQHRLKYIAKRGIQSPRALARQENRRAQLMLRRGRPSNDHADNLEKSKGT